MNLLKAMQDCLDGKVTRYDNLDDLRKSLLEETL